MASENLLYLLIIIVTPACREPAAQAFSDAFFMFDQSENDFAFRLRDFLNRPFPEIEQEWKAKSSARARSLNCSSKRQSSRLPNNNIFNDIKQFCLTQTGQRLERDRPSDYRKSFQL